MSGNAMLTIVASMNAMKTPIEETNRTEVGVTDRRRRERGSECGLSASAASTDTGSSTRVAIRRRYTEFPRWGTFTPNHRARHDLLMATSLQYKIRGAAATLLEHTPAPGPRALADPPAGSGLAPVMGEPGHPVVGTSLAWLKDNLGQARRNYERYGTVFWSNSLGTKVVSVLGPDGIETVLTNRDRAFSNAEGWGYFIGPFFERGVMLMDFEEHRHHRRIMQQAFKRERLVAYLEKVNSTIARVLPTWPHGGDDFRLYNA